MTGPLLRYETLLAQGEITADPHQREAAAALDDLYQGLIKRRGLFSRRSKQTGLYIYGGVGRGKSMLMDLFFHAVKEQVPSRRLHFHEFMLETHDWMHQRRQSAKEDDLLPKYAAHVAQSLKVLCFDEFHVTDVADAMILSRLFTALMERGIVIVATSNWPPEKLYEGGLQRVRFLPFIALLEKEMRVIELDGGIDYRENVTADAHNYFFPYDLAAQKAMDRLFMQHAGSARVSDEIVTVKGRSFSILAANGVGRASFSQLCEQPHGAEDYLALAQRFHTLFIDHIPKMGYDRRNELKRLMTLIDVLYDQRVRVFMSADAPPDKLYNGHHHAFEFERTISRLTEMQSKEYAPAHV